MAKGPENIDTTSEAAPATPASPETRVETPESFEERQRRQREEVEEREAQTREAEADLDGETETPAPAGENPPAAAGEEPKTAMDSFAEMLGKVGDFFGRIGEAIGKAFSKMKSSSMKGLLRFGEMAGFGWAVEFLKQMVEPTEIREAMQRKFPKAEVKEDPANDAVSLQTLHTQYESKLAAEKNDGKNYSFITFYTEKVGKLASGDGTGKTFTLADLTTVGETAPAPGAAPGEAGEKAPEASEKLRHVTSLAEALNEAADDTVIVIDNGDTWENIAQKIRSALNNEKFQTSLALELEENDTLEATDTTGSYWTAGFSDKDIIVGWSRMLSEDPVGAVNALLNLNIPSLELDETSDKSLRKIQASLSKKLKPPAAAAA